MRIGLVLASPRARPLASTRIALLQILPLLAQAGVEAVVLHEPASPEEQPALDGLCGRAQTAGVQVVLFQKVHGPSAQAEAVRLREAGIGSVFLLCDWVIPAMVAACDRTAVVTAHLRALHPLDLQPRMHVVHDGIERPQCLAAPPRPHRGSQLNPLRGVLVAGSPPTHFAALGMPPPWARWECVSAFANSSMSRWRQSWRRHRELPVQERAAHRGLLLHPRVRFEPWSEEGVYAHLAAADFGLIPTPPHQAAWDGELPPIWQRKSENRLTLMMALGLPVIAGPVPAYFDVIDSGRNAYLADTPQEWQHALSALRDPAHRAEMGATARLSVLDRFSKERQAQALLNLFAPWMPSGR